MDARPHVFCRLQQQQQPVLNNFHFRADAGMLLDEDADARDLTRRRRCFHLAAEVFQRPDSFPFLALLHSMTCPVRSLWAIYRNARQSLAR